MLFKAWWVESCVWKLPKPIRLHVLHFRHMIIQILSHISKSIQQLHIDIILTADYSVWHHISPIDDAYRSSNRVNLVPLMPKLNDWHTGLDTKQLKMLYLALQDWYDIVCGKFSTYCVPPDICKMQTAHLCNSSVVWKNNYVALYSNRYIICEKCTLVECAETSSIYKSGVGQSLIICTQQDSLPVIWRLMSHWGQQTSVSPWWYFSALLA